VEEEDFVGRITESLLEMREISSSPSTTHHRQVETETETELLSPSKPENSISIVASASRIGFAIGQQDANLSAGQQKMRKRHEKTVLILILIVLVFLICHSFRLGVQTFQVNN
jgi:hypothetical protein